MSHSQVSPRGYITVTVIAALAATSARGFPRCVRRAVGFPPNRDPVMSIRCIPSGVLLAMTLLVTATACSKTPHTISAMMTPRKDPILKSLIGATSREVRSGFGKHRHRFNQHKLLINPMYMALA